MYATHGQESLSLHLTRCLLQSMQEGLWDEAQKLEAERSKLIRQEFSSKLQLSDPTKLETLREIALLNRQIEAIGSKERARLANQLRQLHQGRKAGKAYMGAT